MEKTIAKLSGLKILFFQLTDIRVFLDNLETKCLTTVL